jgi:hypothetical protein
MKTRKTTAVTAVWMVVAAATIGFAATAHADITGSLFQAPSGNIGCTMIDHSDGTGYAVCRIRDHTWVAPPPGGDCAIEPGGGAGSDLQLFESDPPCVGHWMGQIFEAAKNLPTLDSGQTRTVGTITCDSETSGVTCTATRTGHFFRVSRESYQLG